MLAQFYPPVIGGEERHVRNLSMALAARGHDVHVACLDIGQPPVQDPGVTVHLLPNLGVKVPALYPTADRPLALPMPDPYVGRALARLVREVGPTSCTPTTGSSTPGCRCPPRAGCRWSTRCTTTATSARPSG